MNSISSRILSLAIPVFLSALVTVTIYFLKKPILSEVLFSLVLVAVAYFIFVFICLVFNIGIRKEPPFDFSEIPGLTKQKGWFGQVASTDTSSSVDLSGGGDDPLGCLIGALISLLLPLIVAIAVFVISGGVEVLVFLSTYVCYYSIVRVLRMQLTSRRKTKGNVLASFWYSCFYTTTSVGLLPIGLWLYILLVGRWAF